MNHKPYFKVFAVKLLKKIKGCKAKPGTTVYACYMPHGKVYLSETGQVDTVHTGPVFLSDAKVNIDYSII